MTANEGYKMVLILVFAQCTLLVLYLAFLEYDSDADASDYRNTIHYVKGGFDPKSNTLWKYYTMFQDVHVMIFVGFGFLMTFLKRYTFGAVAFNFLVSALIVQWAILSDGFYNLNSNGKIDVNIVSLLKADIAAAAVLISMGALLGRTTYIQLLIMGVLEISLYSANNYIAGKFYKVSDAGASIFVHTFGAYFGLAVSLVLNLKNKNPDSSGFGSTYVSDTFAMIGTLFLWMFWPSFNAAELTGDSQHRAIINTYISLSACCVVSFIMSWILGRESKFDMVHIQNSTLAGGVAVGASADLMVQPFGAMLIGIFAALLSVFGYTTLTPFIEKRLKITDTCGVHNLHGMPGVLAGVISAIVAAATATTDIYHDSLYQHYPAMAPTDLSGVDNMLNFVPLPGDGRSAGIQAAFQIAALVSTLVIAIVGGLITGLIINLTPCDPKNDVQKHVDDNFWIIHEGHEDPAQTA